MIKCERFGSQLILRLSRHWFTAAPGSALYVCTADVRRIGTALQHRSHLAVPSFLLRLPYECRCGVAHSAMPTSVLHCYALLFSANHSAADTKINQMLKPENKGLPLGSQVHGSRSARYMLCAPHAYVQCARAQCTCAQGYSITAPRV